MTPFVQDLQKLYLSFEGSLQTTSNKFLKPKLKDSVTIEYVYQEMNSFTEGITVPAERKKPWGTAHAVLCAMEKVNEPFAVINADDFYGYDAFKKASNFLESECAADRYAILGYDLLKTLSENGTVNRGVCGGG